MVNVTAAKHQHVSIVIVGPLTLAFSRKHHLVCDERRVTPPCLFQCNYSLLEENVRGDNDLTQPQHHLLTHEGTANKPAVIEDNGYYYMLLL